MLESLRKENWSSRRPSTSFARAVRSNSGFLKKSGRTWKRHASCHGSMRGRHDLVAAFSNFSLVELANPFEPEKTGRGRKHCDRVDLVLPRDVFRRRNIHYRFFG